MLMVDGVSSIGSMPFEFTGWGVDIAVAGSQKGFMLPAGLAILGVSPKAIAAMETATLPRTFFDFKDMLTSYARGGFPYTPPVGLIAGLAHAIDLLETEGLENVYARHHRLAEGVRRAITAWGMTPYAATPDLYSDTVTAVKVPTGCDGTALVQLAASKYGVAFGVGLGEVAGKVFRIGHLGMLTDVMVLSGLATAEMCMADLGWPDQAWLRRGSGAGLLSWHRARLGAGCRMKDLSMQIPTFDDVLAAHARIAPYIHRTPVLTSSLPQRPDRGRAVLQMRELPEGGRVQGARRLQRGLRTVG